MENDVWLRTGCLDCLPGLSSKYDQIIYNERKSQPKLLTSRSSMTYHDRKLVGLFPLNVWEVTRYTSSAIYPLKKCLDVCERKADQATKSWARLICLQDPAPDPLPKQVAKKNSNLLDKNGLLFIRMENDVWLRTGCLDCLPGLSSKYDQIIYNERKSQPKLLTSRSSMTYHDRKLVGLFPLNVWEVTRYTSSAIYPLKKCLDVCERKADQATKSWARLICLQDPAPDPLPKQVAKKNSNLLDKNGLLFVSKRLFVGFWLKRLGLLLGLNIRFQHSGPDRTVILATQNHVATPYVGNAPDAPVGSMTELLHSEEWSIASSTIVVGLKELIVEHIFLELCISKSDLMTSILHLDGI
nr:O-fucosyltransferase 20-like [Tanacetum cinerariifolium]